MSTTISRPVFATEVRIVSMSSGASETGSITSARIPTSARCCCARAGIRRHVGDADQRDVASRGEDARLAERNRIRLLRHVPFLKVKQPVLDEHHGVVVADAGRERALGVVGRGRRDHLETGHVHEEGVQPLRVLRALPPALPIIDRTTSGTETCPPYM